MRDNTDQTIYCYNLPDSPWWKWRHLDCFFLCLSVRLLQWRIHRSFHFIGAIRTVLVPSLLHTAYPLRFSTTSSYSIASFIRQLHLDLNSFILHSSPTSTSRLSPASSCCLTLLPPALRVLLRTTVLSIPTRRFQTTVRPSLPFPLFDPPFPTEHSSSTYSTSTFRHSGDTSHPANSPLFHHPDPATKNHPTTALPL